MSDAELVDPQLDPGQRLTLVDLVDRVVDRGVVLTGDITIAVADIDLIYVGLRVLLSSVETAAELVPERK